MNLAMIEAFARSSDASTREAAREVLARIALTEAGTGNWSDTGDVLGEAA